MNTAGVRTLRLRGLLECTNLEEPHRSAPAQMPASAPARADADQRVELFTLVTASAPVGLPLLPGDRDPVALLRCDEVVGVLGVGAEVDLDPSNAAGERAGV